MTFKGFQLRESPKLSRNVGYAVLAQGVALASSVLMSLVVPKLLGVEGYAYWQLFVLYVGYIGLLLLGVHDGINLRLGGVRLDEIDWPRVKSEFLLVLVLQIIICAVLMAVMIFLNLDANRTAILIFVAIDGIAVNPPAFLFYLLRAANIPNIYSTASLCSGVLWIISLIVLSIVRPEGFIAYIVLYIICQISSSVYCYLHFVQVFKCHHSSYVSGLSDLKHDSIIGLKVTLAYYAGSLVVGSCRMVIDYHWGLEAFGIFSFSVSMVNFVLAFMAQVSMVIFPVVRRMDDGSRANVYSGLRHSLVTILPLIYLIYYPGCWLLQLWLPEYSESLRYLAIILPVCIFDCKMQLLVNTYLKTYRKENALLWLNVGTLAISFMLFLIAAFVFSNLVGTAVAMVAAIALRSVVSEVYVGHLLEVQNSKILISEVILAAWFIVSAYCFTSPLLTFVGVIVFYLVNRKSLSVFIHYAKPGSGN